MPKNFTLPPEAQIEALKAALDAIMQQNIELEEECTELRYRLQ